jgi:hypothetical protein
MKRSNGFIFLMESPLIGGFVEKKHEAITWAWSGK